MLAPKLLMVDDDPANLQVLHEMLAGEGYDISVAALGARALALAALIVPDLILLDIGLPDIDGVEVCRRLKQDPATSGIAIMFITGASDNVSRGFEAGAVDYLTKPVRRDELLARVKTHLQLRTLVHEIEEKNQHLLVAREQLEQRVAERTRQLTEANAQLQREIAERRSAEERLQYLARHDYLTHLLNRTAFEEALGLLLRRMDNDDIEHVLLYLDLDQFKVVNDVAGHVAGDELLCQVAELLRQHLKPADIAARLSGDDFAVILYGVGAAQGRDIAETLINALAGLAFHHEGQRHNVGASIGLVSVRRHASGVANLLSMADTACYAAKEDGRNRVHVYDDNLNDMLSRQEEMRLTPRIMGALADDRFILYRQTIRPLGLATGGQHYEVLIRMLCETGEIISPLGFLGAAERFGTMPQIDRWVIDRVLKHLADHPAEIGTTDCCSINLSGLTLGTPGFATFIAEALKKYGIPPEKICFEITETSAVTNLHRSLQFIRSVRQLGCRFSLDDFGRGVSSYYYLKNLPVDFLKIDGAFVRSMAHDPIDVAMVRSINDIGHAMGKMTIAEYVENETIEQHLRALGVDFAQGYEIGKPEIFIPYRR